ncbi:hypothetical protein JXM83_05325 [Candidatus Woesearchaeota archaeon]|nr:hypothetical protein [Candidatus Woesearchaeota archaeon]
MKHTTKITIIILAMFLVTQFIGLYVVNNYATQKVVDGQIVEINNSKQLPYGMGIPEGAKTEYETNFISIIIAFVIAVGILYLLTHIRAKFVMKGWFLIVTIIALGISFNAFLPSTNYSHLIGLALAIPLAIGKVFKREFLSHNISELFVYPGIAAVFVPLLTLKTAIILLIVISIYDAWAVWKSGIMQKMAKYQMNELKIFSGFFIPYMSKSQKKKIEKSDKKEINKKGVKINVAILGGGDVVFPIIVSGVILKIWGLFPAIMVIFGALLGLGTLLFFSEKKKFYPAMPFISAGIFLAMLLSWLLL